MPAPATPKPRYHCVVISPRGGIQSGGFKAMLLLFILIGVLALGLPLMLMLFGDPPAPPVPPVKPKPAVVQPAPTVLPIEVPQSADNAPAQAPTADAALPVAAPATPPVGGAGSAPAPAPATPATLPKVPQLPAGSNEAVSIPGLPEGTKMPTEAELMKELQQLLDERTKAGK